MVHRCCISSCGMNVRVAEAKGLSYHCFPTKEEMREKWVQAVLQHLDKPESFKLVQGYTRVCSRHFRMKDFSIDSKKRARLSFSAIPSVFPRKNTPLVVPNNSLNANAAIKNKNSKNKTSPFSATNNSPNINSNTNEDNTNIITSTNGVFQIPYNNNGGNNTVDQSNLTFTLQAGDIESNELSLMIESATILDDQLILTIRDHQDLSLPLSDEPINTMTEEPPNSIEETTESGGGDSASSNDVIIKKKRLRRKWNRTAYAKSPKGKKKSNNNDSTTNIDLVGNALSEISLSSLLANNPDSFKLNSNDQTQNITTTTVNVNKDINETTTNTNGRGRDRQKSGRKISSLEEADKNSGGGDDVNVSLNANEFQQRKRAATELELLTDDINLIHEKCESLTIEKNNLTKKNIRSKEKEELILLIENQMDEIKELKQTVGKLKEDHEVQRKKYKNEIRSLEVKSNENWLSRCQAEKRVQEAREETKILKQKLMELTKKESERSDEASLNLNSEFEYISTPLIPVIIPEEMIPPAEVTSYFEDFMPTSTLPNLVGEDRGQIHSESLGHQMPVNYSDLDDPLLSTIRRDDRNDYTSGYSSDNWLQDLPRERKSSRRCSDGPDQSIPTKL